MEPTDTVFAVNCSILFTELPLLARPAAARAAGFHAVEFWWPFDEPSPPAAELAELAAAIDDAEVELTSFGFDHGDLASGDRGLFASEARAGRLRRNMDAVVEVGLLTGCRTFVGLVGKPDAPGDAARDIALRSMAEAAQTVAQIGGEIVVEPISGDLDYLLRTLDETAAFIDEVRAATGTDDLGILADLHHQCRNEVDPAAALRRHVRSIRYLQLADVPGRGVPGSGTAPLAGLLGLLRAGGYDGPVGLEFTPGPEGTIADLARFHEWAANLPPTPASPRAGIR